MNQTTKYILIILMVTSTVNLLIGLGADTLRLGYIPGDYDHIPYYHLIILETIVALTIFGSTVSCYLLNSIGRLDVNDPGRKDLLYALSFSIFSLLRFMGKTGIAIWAMNHINHIDHTNH